MKTVYPYSKVHLTRVGVNYLLLYLIIIMSLLKALQHIAGVMDSGKDKRGCMQSADTFSALNL